MNDYYCLAVGIVIFLFSSLIMIFPETFNLGSIIALSVLLIIQSLNGIENIKEKKKK